eukprot:TRINITY_DN96875_c0_g1_i1.p1 TRINITY_DN96875_c0_g1~~TRINITY_DN96875_c0_g1_i1.p1  ORF type:complete len:117 (-),score=2.42 TRINITY_DN96875_c0_g1_i1:44-394(-)
MVQILRFAHRVLAHGSRNCYTVPVGTEPVLRAGKHYFHDASKGPFDEPETTPVFWFIRAGGMRDPHKRAILHIDNVTFKAERSQCTSQDQADYIRTGNGLGPAFTFSESRTIPFQQ